MSRHRDMSRRGPRPSLHLCLTRETATHKRAVRAVKGSEDRASAMQRRTVSWGKERVSVAILGVVFEVG